MNKETAEKHWEYTEKIIQKMVDVMHQLYVEALIHGAKHGREE